jgi:hypothetical protein
MSPLFDDVLSVIPSEHGSNSGLGKPSFPHSLLQDCVARGEERPVLLWLPQEAHLPRAQVLWQTLRLQVQLKHGEGCSRFITLRWLRSR